MSGVDDPELHGDGPCSLCGRDPSAGRASIYVGGDEYWYCHDEPDEDATSCYEQASHEMVVRRRRRRGHLDEVVRISEELGLYELYEPSPYDGTYSEE